MLVTLFKHFCRIKHWTETHNAIGKVLNLKRYVFFCFSLCHIWFTHITGYDEGSSSAAPSFLSVLNVCRIVNFWYFPIWSATCTVQQGVNVYLWRVFVDWTLIAKPHCSVRTLGCLESSLVNAVLFQEDPAALIRKPGSSWWLCECDTVPLNKCS